MPPPQEEDHCCLPGDITVTQVHSGWMIGRAMEQIGPGPWWSFVAIMTDYETAIYQARTIAKYEGVRAWLHEGLDRYRSIPLDGSDVPA